MAYIENINIKTEQTTSFHPDPKNFDSGVEGGLITDSVGSLKTRSAVFTDEGSFRYDFEGTTLTTNITGTLSLSSTSENVIGVGTLFLTELQKGLYIKVTTDTGTSWRQILNVLSDTELVLDRNYSSTVSGASCHFAWVSMNAGTGATITNSNSIVTMALGTTASVSTRISRTVDYPAVVGSGLISVSQRIVNQDIYIGFSEQSTSTAKYFAWFRLNGTNNTQIILETCGIKSGIPTASDIETQTVTLPAGLNTSQNLLYRIEVKDQRVRFFINDTQIGRDFIAHIPSNYDILGWGVVGLNGTTPASNTNININFFNVNNANEIAVYNPSRAESFINEQPYLKEFAYNQSGVIAINTDLITIDCSQFRSLLLHIIAVGTTGVITGQWSNTPDFTSSIIATFTDQSGAISTTFNSSNNNQLRKVNVDLRYFRLRVTTATTAGATTLNIQGSSNPIQAPILSQNVNGTITANLGANSVMTNVGNTAQGASTYNITISNATNSLTQIKAGATTVNTIHASNTSATGRWLKIFNALSASVVMGTTNATLNYFIPANGSISIDTGAFGIRFATGFTIAITAGIANNDNTSTGTASEVVVSTTYF